MFQEETDGSILVILMLILFACDQTVFGQSPDGMGYKAAAIASFLTNPNLPSCGVGAVQDGNPTDRPSVILIRFKPGCTIPWHWHTPNERLIVISGIARSVSQIALRVTHVYNSILGECIMANALTEDG
jgi:hypothetical protein